MCQMCEEYETELRRLGIAMDEITVRGVERDVVEALEQQAREHGHTFDQEVSTILRNSVSHAKPDRTALIERSRALRASLPPQKTDSLTLLREDRDR